MLELQTNINKDLEEELKERREHRQEQLDTMVSIAGRVNLRSSHPRLGTYIGVSFVGVS